MRLRYVLATAVAALALPSTALGAPPAGMTALALDGRVELAWQAEPAATSYNVYRGTTPTAVTTLLTPAGTLVTSFADSTAVNGTTYYYAVRAVVGGVESANSLVAQATPRARSCASGNDVMLENCFPGSTAWNLANPLLVNGIEGYATAPSIDAGQSVRIKVNTGSAAQFRVEIYRSGYYGGAFGRLISITRGVTGAAQPACTSDAVTGLIDCANWSTSATITTTPGWTSGVYLLRLVREDNGADTHVLLAVRDDARSSDVLYGVGFTDFQAYNSYGGRSLYEFNSGGGTTVSGGQRAVKVSFDRPFRQGTSQELNWYTRIELQAVAWLEEQGYDVAYQSDTDLDRNGARVRNHRAYILPSHDEYYSAGMRTALEQARDAGVNLFSIGANQVYWKIRFEDGPGGADRIQVCYKSTQSGGADPSGIPTGTWRDPAGANRPENALLGTMYVGDNDAQPFPFVVSAAAGRDRLYRYTGLDAQPAGTSTSIAGIVGWEWDARVANGFEPAGVTTLATSPVSGNLLTDAGRVYAPGSTTVHFTRYRAASGALVVAAGTNQWGYGLGRTPLGDGVPDVRIQQVTANVLSDMGVLPSTPLDSLTVDDPVGTVVVPPTGVAATADGSDAVRLTWNAVAGATGYRVYRTTAARAAGVPVGTLVTTAPIAATTFTNFGLNAGATYYYVVVAVRGGVQSSFSSEVSATTASAGAGGVRMNVGGPAYTSAGGRTYIADSGFTGGQTWSIGETVSGTSDPALYQNERWGQFSYAIPVANGIYDVRLHFVELYYGVSVAGSCVGKRIFGFDVLDTPGIDIPNTMDVCAEAGGPRAALIKVVNGVQVADGALDVRSVYGSVDDPQLAAIEVVPGVTGPPTVTSTAPAAGATGVATTASVSATFSRAMDAATINGSNFTLRRPDGTAVPATVSYAAASSSAQLVPSAALAASTTYTATVGTGVRSTDGQALAAPLTWSFTTAAPPPAPTVTAVNPAAGATGVATSVAPSATFSRTMDAASINGTTFTLRRSDGSAVAGSVSYDAATTSARFTPSVALATSTSYTATVSAGARATDGQPLAAPVSWTFTTAAAPAPTVTSTGPANGATGVDPASVISATFSRAMDAASLNGTSFTLRTAAGASVAGTVSYDAPTTTARLTPAAPLESGTSYTARLEGTVRAADGVLLAAPVTWSFSTSGGAAGTTTARINAGGGAFTAGGGIAYAADAQFTGGATYATNSAIAGTTDDALYQNERWGQFSYAIPVANGTYDVRLHFVELYYGTAVSGSCVGKRIFGMDVVDTAGTDIPNTLDVCAEAGGPNTALVKTIAGVAITDGTLDLRSIYGAVDDPEVAAIEVVPSSGGAPPPPPPPPAPPTVVSQTPADGATSVSASTATTATFSRAMDAATVNSTTFTLSPTAGNAVAATVSYDAGSLTATLTPSAALAPSTTYTARLTTGVRAADGTALASAYAWSFTTAAPSTGGAGTTTVRINVGGNAFTAAGGLVFQADTGFTGGATYSVNSAIAGTTDDTLYQNERWGQFSYAIPVANGRYDVRLHFVEMYYGTAIAGSCVGQRIFGFDVVDTAAADVPNTLDVCASAGGPNTALVRTIAGVDIADGTLNLRSVYGSVDDPELAAIEVVPAG